MQHSKIRSVINYYFLGTETVLRTTDHEMIPWYWGEGGMSGAVRGGGRLATGTTTRLLYMYERLTVLLPQTV